MNRLFGDIVKVTPSSKVVGDMALFMVQNDLSEDDVYEKGDRLDFPESVVQFFQGYIGQPPGGFPERLQQIVLKGRKPLEDRPGKLLPEVDFAETARELEEKVGRPVDDCDVMSYIMYPKVFLDKEKMRREYGDLGVLDTPTFFYGLKVGEEVAVDIEQGKTLIVKLMSVGPIGPDGKRTVYFELNGQPREVAVPDLSADVSVELRRKRTRTMRAKSGPPCRGKC